MSLSLHDFQKQSFLALKIPDAYTFDSFYSGANKGIVLSLKNAIDSNRPNQFMICGDEGSGKSHILTALYNYTNLNSENVLFLDFNVLKNLPCEIINIEPPKLALFDNIHAVAGNLDWENAIFAFYNRYIDSRQGIFVATSNVSVDKIKYIRKDLNTRLLNGITFKIAPLDEEGCAQALVLKAQSRGMSLSKQVAIFLVNNFNKDMKNLVKILDTLDDYQLQAQRTLSIPFVKKVLNL